MSWESSRVRYEYLNQMAREQPGGSYSARIILPSVGFAVIVSLTVTGNWEGNGEVMALHA